MKARKKWECRLLLIFLVVGLLGAVGLLTSCKEEEEAAANGTITVRLVNAAVENGELFLFAVFAAGADIATDDPIGLNGNIIPLAGTVEEVALDFDTLTTPVSFTGGSSYDVYGFVDWDLDEAPTTGEPFGSKLAVVVDGNMVVELDYDDFIAFP